MLLFEKVVGVKKRHRDFNCYLHVKILLEFATFSFKERINKTQLTALINSNIV